MLKIRLQRVGRKHEPVFRVVVVDSHRGPKSGNFKEILGSYDPRDKARTQLKDERVKYWISQGAQLSGTVHNLFIDNQLVKGEKLNVLPKKSPVKKKNAPEEEPKKEEVSDKPEPAESEAPTPAEAESESRPESVGTEESSDQEESKEESKPESELAPEAAPEGGEEEKK